MCFKSSSFVFYGRKKITQAWDKSMRYYEYFLLNPLFKSRNGLKYIHWDPFDRGEKEVFVHAHIYTHTHTSVWGGGLSACVCVHLRVKSTVLIFMVINSGGHLAAGTADQALIESKCVCWERGRVTWNGTNVFLIELRVYMRVCVCVATGSSEAGWRLWASQLVAISQTHATCNLTHNLGHSDWTFLLIIGVC